MYNKWRISISPIDKNQLKNMKNLIDQLAEQHEQIFSKRDYVH